MKVPESIAKAPGLYTNWTESVLVQNWLRGQGCATQIHPMSIFQPIPVGRVVGISQSWMEGMSAKSKTETSKNKVVNLALQEKNGKNRNYIMVSGGSMVEDGVEPMFPTDETGRGLNSWLINPFILEGQPDTWQKLLDGHKDPGNLAGVQVDTKVGPWMSMSKKGSGLAMNLLGTTSTPYLQIIWFPLMQLADETDGTPMMHFFPEVFVRGEMQKMAEARQQQDRLLETVGQDSLLCEPRKL